MQSYWACFLGGAGSEDSSVHDKAPPPTYVLPPYIRFCGFRSSTRRSLCVAHFFNTLLLLHTQILKCKPRAARSLTSLRVLYPRFHSRVPVPEDQCNLLTMTALFPLHTQFREGKFVLPARYGMLTPPTTSRFFAFIFVEADPVLHDLYILLAFSISCWFATHSLHLSFTQTERHWLHGH